MPLEQTSTPSDSEAGPADPYRDISTAQIIFQVTGGDPGDFHVQRFRGAEGLCQLYRFEIEASSELTSVAFADIVGKAAVMSINADAGTRWFHGVVSRFEMTGETAGLVYYRIELVPAVWLLTHRYNSRIFQNKTVAEIIEKVLKDAGIATDRFSLAFTSPSLREYCVQYRETDYNFICRLMEEEGARWYFSQDMDGHTFQVTDAPTPYTPIEGESPEIQYKPPTGTLAPGEKIHRFRIGQAVRPGAVVLNDFNWQKPQLLLQAPSDCGRDASLSFYDYPGEYSTQDDGSRYAKLRAEEFESGRTIGIGVANSLRLAVGFQFDLSEHPSEPTNGSYMITRITHQGRQSTGRTSSANGSGNGVLSPRVKEALRGAQRHEDPLVRELAEGLITVAQQFGSGDDSAHRALTDWLYHAGQVARDISSTAAAAGASPVEALAVPNLLDDVARSMLDEGAPAYSCKFECIPAGLNFRPPRVSPWPVMRGSQTARVVGPQGEEIHTDEHGRVKVQFHWDREGKHDENSSCWIRVSQGMAGGGYGMFFLPRVGQEVIVDFLEGDPDKPIIVGRVYNADHPPPYALPAEKTKSSIKGRSSPGGGGSNEIRFDDAAGKEQMVLYGQKDLHIRFKNDAVQNIEHDCNLTVGNNRNEEVTKNYSLKVTEDIIQEIGKDLSLKVTGKTSTKVDGTHSVDVTGDVVEKFGAGHKHEVTGTYAAKAASIKLEASSGLELKCGGSSIVLTPGAIFIVGGPTVNINSGSGPPVGPVGASATAPAAVADAIDACTVEHGKDTRYGGGEEQGPADAQAEMAGDEFEKTKAEEEETTWIDLDLKDEEGHPCAGEPYRVIDSKGKKHEGSLDANGKARVRVSKGKCDITYPRLDNKSWKRTA